MIVKKQVLVFCSMCALSGCTTLDKSFQLGGALGAATGAGATYSAGISNGGDPKLQDVGIGAAVGFGIGLLTSYLIHESVATDRAEAADDTELYFGDLPPSPFVIPQKKLKKDGFR